MSALGGHDPEAMHPRQQRQRLTAELELPREVDASANAWLNRVRSAENFKTARQARDEATDSVAGLQQRRAISGTQADLLRAAVDRQWFDRIVMLDTPVAGTGTE